MTARTFVTPDERIAVEIDARAFERILAHCRRADRNETGGILIGRYSKLLDQAKVTEATGPSVDSIHRRLSFVRGLVGMQRRVDRAWRRRDYYLGEWHFHPLASAEPSDQDRKQIIEFAGDPAYACPEPILVVVGGNPNADVDLTVSLVLDGVVVALVDCSP